MNMIDKGEMLGFVPQREIIYNNLLQYGEALDQESQKYLIEIKINLGKSILCQDMRDVMYWTSHLLRYTRLYGHKFSKEDHIHFIKVYFEVITIPELECVCINKIATMMHILLKKTDLISRDDLELPWRPLYDLHARLFLSSFESVGMILCPSNLESHMKTLIRDCSRYFSLESTQEILDEFKPYMCPFDTEMSQAICTFEYFLCTTIPPEHHDKGFKLWFTDLMNLWENWQNIPNWEHPLLCLLSRLAEDNIGYIDWEPYIPLIFTRLLRSFNLPGRTNSVQVVRAIPTLDTAVTSVLIASMLGMGSSCQLHITSLFKALESFYHPSNYGRWLVKMQKLLQRLPLAVTRRLHKERHAKPSWRTQIPQHAKLTNDDVTAFVKSIVPAVLLSMFSKRGSTDSSLAIQNLGALRPEAVLPPLLERLYSSLETLTEPHRLTATMHCIVPVCRSFVQLNKYFPEGPKHVIPILIACLPGIDPNDIKKCMVTFQFISTIVSLVLIVDCSSAVNSHPDLPENIQEVCLQTAMFEDFVLQFMDRCFSLIENSCLDNHNRLDRDSERINPEEQYMEIGLYSTFGLIVMQCSPAIYEVVLSKLQTFVTTHILEINVSGKFAANMCRVVAKVKPELGLKAFIPHFSKLVLALTEAEDIINEERLDDELLFSLLILSQVVRSDGKYVLSYHDQIMKVLERTLNLKCKEGYRLACSLLSHTLKAYLMIYPLNNCSVPNAWSRYGPDEVHEYLKDWGVPGNIHNLDLMLHLPSDEEVGAAKMLLEKFLLSEIDKLKKWANKENVLSRDEVHCTLTIVHSSLMGAAFSLPMWDEPQLNVRESSLPLYQPFALTCGAKDIVLNDQNVRQVVTEVMHKVLVHIFETCEDDTKSLISIIKIFNVLMFNWGVDKEEYDARVKGFRAVKSALENKLYGQKKHIRSILVDRVHLQHEYRVADRYRPFFTQTHQGLLEDLLKLSVSHYAEVRKHAQSSMHRCLAFCRGSKHIIFDTLLETLKKDPTEFHEEFKGILYVIVGNKNTSILCWQSWDKVRALWPALVASKHSEKPSIIRLLDSISGSIQKNLTTNQIHLEQFSSSCFDIAKKFWDKQRSPSPTTDCLTDEEIEHFTKCLASRNKDREKSYFKLIDALLDLVKNGNLHWRHYRLALNMLQLLIRHDIRFPKEGVELFVSHMIHDTLAIRKIAQHSVSCILKQVKQNFKKVTIDPTTQNPSNPVMHPLMPKVDDEKLPENFWLMYNSLDLPDTEEKWNSRHFVHKTYWGCSQWPKKFEVPAPHSEQPSLNRSLEELTEEEKPIYEAFTQQKYVDSLISFLSLEEKKGQDKFDTKKFYLFKSLFARFGVTFLPYFIDHLHRMVADKSESVQRCCAEIVAGLVHGSKHYDFHMMNKVKEEISPIFKKAISNVFPDTLNDWVTCISTISESRDPNKYYWVFELFMKEPQSIENGSFLESSWILILNSLLCQQEWRAFELLHRAYAYILPKLDHIYQNVREKLGSFLSFILMYDIPSIQVPCLVFAPKIESFINEILPRLEILYPNKEAIENRSPNCTEIPPERKQAENLFRTVCWWVTYNGSKSIYTAPPALFQLLPLICHMINDTSDDELKRESLIALAILSQSLLGQESVNAAITTVQKICKSPTWHSRMSAASYLQQMVFSNLYTVMQNKSWTNDIYNMVLTLLQDERVEVRETAAETLCGFLHCEYFKLTDELMNMFKSKSQRKLSYKAATENGPRTLEQEDLRERHAGVLGLCACVNAFPYDVPEFLPDILVLIADHLNDPQPISATIKKTLSSFRRTHHDNWRDHKLKFTDDQLAVITDLLVSPSYYA